MPRVGPGQAACTGTWPITGNPCRNPPRAGHGTCLAHDPSGDLRPTPPRDAKRCTANNKESGDRCRNGHGAGGKVCGKHGGKAAQNKAAAKSRTAEKKARALVATYGLPVKISPEQAILDEVHRSAGHVAWLEQVVHALEPDDLIWGVTKTKQGGEDYGTTEEAVPHAYLKLYLTERAHLAKVCADAIRVGIEARQVKLAEEQGAMVAKAVRAILDDLQLTAAQRALIPTIVPLHLRDLALRN